MTADLFRNKTRTPGGRKRCRGFVLLGLRQDRSIWALASALPVSVWTPVSVWVRASAPEDGVLPFWALAFPVAAKSLDGFPELGAAAQAFVRFSPVAAGQAPVSSLAVPTASHVRRGQGAFQARGGPETRASWGEREPSQRGVQAPSLRSEREPSQRAALVPLQWGEGAQCRTSGSCFPDARSHGQFHCLAAQVRRVQPGD